jgi:hypothetical protein
MAFRTYPARFVVSLAAMACTQHAPVDRSAVDAERSVVIVSRDEIADVSLRRWSGAERHAGQRSLGRVWS